MQSECDGLFSYRCVFKSFFPPALCVQTAIVTHSCLGVQVPWWYLQDILCGLIPMAKSGLNEK